MPSVTTVTCDICGEEGRTYPSFFQVWDFAQNEYLPAGGNMMVRAPVKLGVDTDGLLPTPFVGRAANMYLHLCADHFASLTTACEAWLAEAGESE